MAGVTRWRDGGWRLAGISALAAVGAIPLGLRHADPVARVTAAMAIAVIAAIGIDSGATGAPWWLTAAAVALLVLVVAVLLFISSATVLARNLYGQDRRVWAAPDNRSLLTGRLNVDGTWAIGNAGTWPLRVERARAFLRGLADEADQQQWTVHTTAANQHLYRAIYQDLGFTQTGGRLRPKLTRHPSTGDGGRPMSTRPDPAVAINDPARLRAKFWKEHARRLKSDERRRRANRPSLNIDPKDTDPYLPIVATNTNPIGITTWYDDYRPHSPVAYNPAPNLAAISVDRPGVFGGEPARYRRPIFGGGRPTGRESAFITAASGVGAGGGIWSTALNDNPGDSLWRGLVALGGLGLFVGLFTSLVIVERHELYRRGWTVPDKATRRRIKRSNTDRAHHQISSSKELEFTAEVTDTALLCIRAALAVARLGDNAQPADWKRADALHRNLFALFHDGTRFAVNPANLRASAEELIGQCAPHRPTSAAAHPTSPGAGRPKRFGQAEPR